MPENVEEQAEVIVHVLRQHGFTLQADGFWGGQHGLSHMDPTKNKEPVIREVINSLRDKLQLEKGFTVLAQDPNQLIIWNGTTAIALSCISMVPEGIHMLHLQYGLNNPEAHMTAGKLPNGTAVSSHIILANEVSRRLQQSP